jgi:hypothetical protein
VAGGLHPLVLMQLDLVRHPSSSDKCQMCRDRGCDYSRGDRREGGTGSSIYPVFPILG